MGLARQRPGTNAFAMDVLCARILERHRDSVRVQKPHLAVPNLTRIIGATLTLSNKHGFHATTLRQLAEAPASAWAASIPISTASRRCCR